MCAPRLRTADKGRLHRLTDVDHVHTGTASTSQVRETRLFIDYDVMAALHHVESVASIQEIRIKDNRWIQDVSETGEIEDLHAMCACPVRNDEGVVPIRLDISPQLRAWRVRGLREVTDEHRVRRVRDVDERRTVVASNESVFATGLRVRPAPVVIRSDSARGFRGGQQRDRDVGQQLDVVAVEGLHGPFRAPSLLTEDGAQGIGRAQENVSLPPRSVVVTFVDEHSAGLMVEP